MNLRVFDIRGLLVLEKEFSEQIRGAVEFEGITSGLFIVEVQFIDGSTIATSVVVMP